MKYRHIVFDVDGTLTDTEYAILHSLQDTLMELTGKEIPCPELTFALGITGEDALERLAVQNIPTVIDSWNKKMCGYADTIRVFDGINGLLDELLKLDCELGIVTSRTREEFEQDFCRFGLRRYFQSIVCADDTKEHKPDAAPLLKYMELAGAAHGEVLYVGDSEYDSKCAESAGTDFALAVWGSHNRIIKADYFPEKPADLLSAIEMVKECL